jgi:hypothetical protein
MPQIMGGPTPPLQWPTIAASVHMSEVGVDRRQSLPQHSPKVERLIAPQSEEFGEHAAPLEAGGDLTHQRVVRGHVDKDEAVRVDRPAIQAVQ